MEYYARKKTYFFHSTIFDSANRLNESTMSLAVTAEAIMIENQRQNIASVVAAYGKRLLGFIRKRVENEADAEDILQDVFYQFIGNTQPIEQITAWLFRVARNRIVDVKRKHKPELLNDVFGDDSTEDDDNGLFGWADMLTDLGNTPETTYLRNLFWETLHLALNELPEEQKQVFILHELDGVSFKDIAQQTKETVNTLISRKRYAVLHLRKRLQVLYNEIVNY